MSKAESNYFDGKHDINFPYRKVKCDSEDRVWILHLCVCLVSDLEK